MFNNVAILKSIIRNPFAWPGGYERFAIMDDGGVLCKGCCKSEYKLILASTRSRMRDGWCVIADGSAADTDDALDCSHCGKTIVEGFDNEDNH